MRKPRVFFRWMRRAWRRWSTPPSETRAISSIDTREFSDLLRSGRKKDLETLARRLSQHTAQPKEGARRDPSARGVSSSKGPGVTLLSLRQDASFAEVKGAFARQGWSGLVTQAPPQLRGWLGLRDQFLHAPDQKTLRYVSGSETFLFRFEPGFPLRTARR